MRKSTAKTTTTMSTGASKLDTLLLMLGWRLQAICSFFLIYVFMHSVAMNFIISFVSMTPPHQCNLPADWAWPENASIPHHRSHRTDGSWELVYDSCHVFTDPFNRSLGVRACPDGYNYRYDEGVYRTSISTEWNLVCDEKYLVRVFQLSYFVGVVAGGVTGGYMCDSLGRRPVWLLNEALYLVIGMTFYLDFGFVVSCLILFVLGTAMQSKLQAAYTLALEMFPDRYRTKAAIFTFSAPALSYAFATILAYFIRDWRSQVFLHAILTLVNIPAYWLTPESIRWFVARRRNRDAELACHAFARFNDVALPPSIERDISDVVEAIEYDLRMAKKESMVDVLKSTKLRCYLLIVSFTLYSAQLSLYGFSFLMSEISGDVYRNSFIVSVVDFVLRMFSYFTLNRFGRRSMIIYCLTIMGGFHLLSVVIRVLENGSPTLKIAAMIAGIVARVLNGAFFCSFSLIIVEVFPTTVRMTAQGMVSAAGRVGLMSTPLILFLSDYAWKQLPFAVFGVLGVTSGLLCILLPETKGRPMPSTIEEAVRLSKRPLIRQPVTTTSSSPDPEQQRLPIKCYLPEELVPLSNLSKVIV